MQITTSTGIFLIVGILVLVLFIGVMRNHTEWILNFILRGVSGMMMIYFANYALKGWAPGMEIGYNLLTFLTSGILGFPGVAMLYGIIFYMQL
ncbi:MAG TPA: pro-sigmaK processing inhibitor BofA family protein [Lachnospiraceae bacterium]|nr:pro-sigmaK processing inhibitor BofA family protein [Lachnospiraceae bacterium]